MRGKRVRSHNWNPMACSAQTEFENIVIIDVDCDSCENVVLLDDPESIKQKFRGPRRQSKRIITFHDVISIDDDDDLPGPSGAAVGSDGLDRDYTSIQRNSIYSDTDVDDCCVIPDRHSTSGSPAIGNHQSREHVIERRFGLSVDLEEDASENDFSDSEVMGDSTGDIRQQWEEASLRRKASSHCCGERSSLDCGETSTEPAINDDLINGRERLKESDEFKRANEEELASRQLQIKLQAEEAQRLRRKNKAELMRKQDMERRQKQRVDEIRETQKKDVETMNLREQLRAEIRMELSKLELRCFDMASLLNGLGIHVPGHPPPSKEVHAAYKKALLKFHPDRASTKDIRQQVEAEEIFKLISRMKEKFPFT